jgi:hypothetical protein
MRRSLAAVGIAIAVAVSAGAALTGRSSEAAQHGLDVGGQTSGGRDQHRKFVDRHGLVLSSELLYLIYWGSAWTYLSTTPTADQAPVRFARCSPAATWPASHNTAASAAARSVGRRCWPPPSRPTGLPTTTSPDSCATSSQPARSPVRTPTTRRCTAS